MVEQIFNKNHVESENLIEHIEDAKGWLDKAKEYYVQANPTNAEMTLNLAQAEVKHVWELSRRRFVSTKHKTTPIRKFNYRSAAASILILIGLVFGFQRENINKYLAGVFKPIEKSVSVDSGSKLASSRIVQKTIKEVESSKTVQPESNNSVKPVNQTPVLKDSTEVESATTVAESSRERPDSEIVQNTVRVRQVSQIAIDEDALTKEASHSLRNGK